MSLVELMVAIVILALGVLGLAATSDAGQRAMTRGRQRAVAAGRAGRTVDSLRGQACRVTGSMSGAGRGQTWSISAAGSARFIIDSVQMNGRQFAVEGAVLCP